MKEFLNDTLQIDRILNSELLLKENRNNDNNNHFQELKKVKFTNALLVA